MKRLQVDDHYRGNPIVEAQVAQVFTSIQEEICGEIEGTLGSLSEKDQHQLLKSILRTRLKYGIFFESSLYAGPHYSIEKRFVFSLPDPFTWFSGFFELNVYQIPILLSRTEVFFYYDFIQSNWIFRTKPDSQVSLAYDMQTHSFTVEFSNPIHPVTPWHILQFKNLRLINR